MDKYTKATLTVIAVCFLVGCVKTAKDYQYTPTAVLCERLLNTPGYNVNRKARELALYKRGEDCSQYTHLKRNPDTVIIQNGGSDPFQPLIDLGKPKCRDGRLPDPMYGCGQPTLQPQLLRCNTNMFGQTTCW
jgi:hypothetical protein